MKWTNARRLAAPAIAAVGLGLAGCGDDSGGADAGKQLTIYSGREAEYVAPLIKNFEQGSGIKVKIRYGETAELAATLIEEGSRSPADVFFAQDAGGLGAVEKEGLLAPLPQEILSTVPARYRSPQSVWVGTSGRARALAYDGRKLKPSQLPASVFDLTKPEWKGKVGWAPANASFQAFVTAMRKVEGDDRAGAWLKAMKANDAQTYEKNSLIRDAIDSQEIEAGLINHYYVLEAAEEGGGDDYPVKLHFFPGGDVGSLVNAAGIGILQRAPHTDTAKAFASFLLSRGSQEYFADKVREYPLVKGVEAAPKLPALSSIKQPDVTLSDLDDLKGTLELLQKSGVL